MAVCSHNTSVLEFKKRLTYTFMGIPKSNALWDTSSIPVNSFLYYFIIVHTSSYNKHRNFTTHEKKNVIKDRASIRSQDDEFITKIVFHYNSVVESILKDVAWPGIFSKSTLNELHFYHSI